jgi:hypothetical protein
MFINSFLILDSHKILSDDDCNNRHSIVTKQHADMKPYNVFQLKILSVLHSLDYFNLNYNSSVLYFFT